MRATTDSLRLLRRNLRTGEFALLGLSLLVAVTAITAVNFFTDRVRAGMAQQAGEVFGADVVVQGSAPLADSLFTLARDLGLTSAHTITLPVSLQGGDRSIMVAVRAVSDEYPLRGTLNTRAAPFGRPLPPAEEGPGPGQAWVDNRLFSMLDLEIGDPLELGSTKLQVTRALDRLPHISPDPLAIAPQVLIRLQDLPATGLLQPGTIARHRLLASGGDEASQRFVDGARALLTPDQTLYGRGESGPELAHVMRRGEQFLNLAALVSVMVAAVGVAGAARQYAERNLDGAALWRAFGASHARVFTAHFLSLLWLGAAVSAVGAAIGYLAQFVLAALLAEIVGGALPLPGWSALWLGAGTALLVLLGFGLPPLLAIREVAPLRVLKRDLAPVPTASWLLYGSASVALVALVWLYIGDPRLTAVVLGGAAISAVLLVLGGWALISVTAGLRRRVGIAWRFGIANIARRRGESVVQITGFGLGILVLLLLTLVRQDLIAGWRTSLPAQSPDYVLLGIDPGQREVLGELFRRHGLEPPALHPMVRMRLTHIGDQPAIAGSLPQRLLAQRDLSLSPAAEPGPGNEVVAGRWWQRDDWGRRLVSLDRHLAQALDLEVGDRLTLYAAGQSLTFTVANLREVQWQNLQMNFPLVTPPETLQGLAATYVSAFDVPAGKLRLLDELLRQLPAANLIEAGALLDQALSVVNQITLAVDYIFLFTLTAGIMVLLTAVQATRGQRRRESALLRTLGAPATTVAKGVIAEFATLGLLAGLLGGICAVLVGQSLAVLVFDFTYRPSPLVPVLGMAAGVVGIGLTGLAGTYGVLRQPPLRTLNEG